MAEFDGFEFIITEEDDVLLVIYARSTNPENPAIELVPNKKQAMLYRNPADTVLLENVADDVFENLKEETALLVAEVIPTNNPLEHEIKQVYNAMIATN